MASDEDGGKAVLWGRDWKMINKHEIEALKKYLNENGEDSPRIARSFLEDSIPVLEKQIPQKPVTYNKTNRADCPICGATVRGIGKSFGGYCSKCGQAIDWR